MTIIEEPVEAEEAVTVEDDLGDDPGRPLIPQPADDVDDDEISRATAIRYAIAATFPAIGAAVMVGGIFNGVSPRIYASFGAILGVLLAFFVSKVKSAGVTNLMIAGGLFLIGLIVAAPGGPGDLPNIGDLASQAAREGGLTRPPVDWSIGWQAIVGWLMGIVGFVTAWVAIVVKKPSVSVLLPLPIAAIAAISVPESAQVASGIAVLVLFALALGVLSSERATGDDGTRPPLSYELARAARSLPLLVVITGALFFLAQSDFLFPDSVIDPAQEPQKPKTVPITEVEDRVLFEVESSVSGPWRIGSLDVYDGKDWRLPPFADNQLEEVPSDGVVDQELFGQRGPQGIFTIRGFGGAVLPGLPNTVGIIAEGPSLEYDSRNGNIRVQSGQVRAGLEYTVVGAALPNVDDLRALVFEIDDSVAEFAEIPPAPTAVQDLLTQATASFDNEWDRFDFLRREVLDNIVSAGPGVPTEITPERVQEIIAVTQEASPFEIVAMQAMLARWAGIPSRIGYGFDGGEAVDENRLEIRPKHGASFVEVWFPGFKWLPVIGTPKQAKPSVGSDPELQQVDPTILPSSDIAVQIYLPVVVPPGSTLAQQIVLILAVGTPIVLLIVAAYVFWPAFRKSRIRNRRREAAYEAGPRARIALAYAEWRDWATDFGFEHESDTPLFFLDRFVEDEEHNELAWITTRALWGDLRDDLATDLAHAAEELSRSLRQRLAASQPATMRFVAWVSRQSMRRPYAPGTDLTVDPKREKQRKKELEELQDA